MFGSRGLYIMRTSPKAKKFGSYITSKSISSDTLDLELNAVINTPSKIEADRRWKDRMDNAKIERIAGIINFTLVSLLFGIFVYYLFL